MNQNAAFKQKPTPRKETSELEPPQEEAKEEESESLLDAVAAMMATCTRRLQRAARRVAASAGKQGLSSPIASRAMVQWRKAFSLLASATAKAKTARSAAGGGGRAEDSVGLWRKEILMGERCQPLEFSGVIYYDTDGRRLAHPPPPRSPMRSPLPVSVKLAANAGGGS